MRILIAFLVGIFLLIILMAKTQIGPFLSLVLASAVIGVGCGMKPLDTVSALNDGLASTCKSLALIIVFGTILGNVLDKSGACECIAETLIRTIGEKYVDVALAITAYIVAIPVFSDVALIIMAPVIIEVARKTGQRVAVLATIVACSLITTNAWVIPTPQPLSVISVLNIDAGQSVIVGMLVSFVAAVCCVLFCKFFFQSRPDSYFTYYEEGISNIRRTERKSDMKPGFIKAICPIVVPTFLLMASSIVGMIQKQDSIVFDIIAFLGDKNIAVGIGMLVGVLCLKKYIPNDNYKLLYSDSLKTAGPIILVTCGGGALAKMVQTAGVGDVLVDLFGRANMPVILAVFLITALSEFATGSGAVSALLSASVTLPLVNEGLINPLVAFVIIGAGTNLGCHVNSSFFWVFSEIFRTDTKTSLKTLCLARNLIIPFVGLGFALVMNLFL